MTKCHLMAWLSYYILNVKCDFVEAQKYVGQRFQRILNLVPKDKSVADIGADHGRLTSYLYYHLDEPHRKVAYVDKAQLAFNTGAEYLKSQYLFDKIPMLHGDGLLPLVENKYDINTIVIAGMGSNTIKTIVSHQIHAKSSENEKSSHSKSNLAVDMLNTELLITQSWPSYLLQVIDMIGHIQQTIPFILREQFIDEVHDQYYVTQSFHRIKPCNSDKKEYCPITSTTTTTTTSTSTIKSSNKRMVTSFNQLESISSPHHYNSDHIMKNVFIQMPLSQRCLNQEMSTDEKILWKQYLLTQMTSLQKNIQYNYKINSRKEIYDCITEQLNLLQ